MSEKNRKKQPILQNTMKKLKLKRPSPSLSTPSSPASSITSTTTTTTTTCNSLATSSSQTFVIPSEPPQITRMKYEEGKYDLQEIYNRQEFVRTKVMNLDREIDAYAQSLSDNVIVGQSIHLFFSSVQQKSLSSSIAPEENQVSNQEEESQPLSESNKNKKRKLRLIIGNCKDSVMKKKETIG